MSKVLPYLSLAAFPIIFICGWIIFPYDKNGDALLSGTHTQIFLPPCIFKSVTGLPCAGCGLTTSCSLFVRGDFGNSVRANIGGIFIVTGAFIIFLRNICL